MESPVIISLCISGVLAIMQVWNFIENKASRKEDRLKIYAKEIDVKDEINSITTIINDKLILINESLLNNREIGGIQASKLELLNTELHIMKERVDNEIRTTSKSLDKLESKLDDIIREI